MITTSVVMVGASTGVFESGSEGRLSECSQGPTQARTYVKFRAETADPSAVKRMMGVVRGGLWLSLN
jgi:hypothetical protein